MRWLRYSPLLLLLASILVGVWEVQWVLLALLLVCLLWSTQGERWTRRKVWGFCTILLFILLGVLPLLFVRLSTGLKSGSEILCTLTPHWGITRASLHAFGLVGLRCLNAYLSLLLFTTLTPIYQLLIELREVGLASILVELVEMTYRFINLLFDTSHEITEAQRSRLGYLQPRQSLQHFSMMLSRTLVLSMHDSDIMYDAMLSRGAEAEGGDLETKGSTKGGSAPHHQAEKTLNSTPSFGTEVMRLVGLSFRYQETHKKVLREVSFSVARGEKLVLMGANGAGKSTLMRLMAGLLRPSSGQIRLHGADVTRDAKALRSHVGILFQNADLQLFTPTVWEEIAFGLRNKGLKGEELAAKVTETLHRFGLQELAQHPPHLLSGGQKKWVTIAAVDALSPEIILLDEPAMGLDGKARQALMQILDSWHKEQKTLIISCHNADFAQAWGDRILLIEEHRLQRDEAPLSFFANRELLERTHITPALHRLTLPQPEGAHVVESHESRGFLPLFLRSSTARAILIGGGRGAYRKALTLRKVGLPFDLIAPSLDTRFEKLLQSPDAGHYFQRNYQQGDLRGYTLAILATGDLAEELEMIQECEHERIHYNCLTDPSRSTFQFGAIASDKGVEVAVHTQWQLPEVAQWLRDELVEQLLSSLEAEDLRQLSEVRQRKNKVADDKESSEFLTLQEEYTRLLSKICQRTKPKQS